jgi:putative ABC transport system permease protein
MMFSWFRQLFALASFNIRTLPTRAGSAIAAIGGIAGVVAVLVGVLSIGEGFRRVMVVQGKPDTVLVLRGGADSEMASVIVGPDVGVIESTPGIAKDSDGKPLAAPELSVILDLPKRTTHTPANVPMRGIQPRSLTIRPEVKVVEGRMFHWGTNEVVVGRGAQLSFAGTDVGSEIHSGQNTWKVVGIFESKGGISESELWADASVLAPAYRRANSFQTVMVKLASAGGFNKFRDALTTDPRVSVRVLREEEYYAGQSKVLRQLVTALAFVVCSLMGLAAIFGALNTMYTAVAARARETATLEALGFSGSAVVISVIAEAVLLSLIGGAIGGLGAYLAFDGYRAATMNFATFSQVAFAFDVTPRLLIMAIIYAAFIGLIGGLFPAIRAARQSVSVALRET